MVAALGVAVIAPVAAQQRNPLQTIGETVLDQPAQSYRFERFVIEDGAPARRWRVHVGVPTQQAKAPAPVLYMLDGNAAAMVFDQALLGELAAHAAPVLVFIGYDNDLRIDSRARTQDYTAWVDTAEDENGVAQSTGGGAASFLQVIQQKIKPEVARRARVDTQQQALWGHSLGGLFVLSTLYTQPDAFQQYVSASPSLWWSQGAPQGELEQRFVAHPAPAKLWLMLGGDERSGNRGVRDMSNPRVVAHLRRIAGATPDAAHVLSGRLAAVPGLQVTYREFPGLGHGPMLPASLKATLAALYGVPD
ncbi:alpha/beta hydrolase-fold protein [uncultured Stenotrophomonas sp.]|uniref:alpha/beta hydrolase n=1 Tax=uncultured Stenotrophomonas sp. TaxID=165438 RepID=UPI0028D3261E|nr:alpha/beta hydrolase-fold protein [uncultured Stenotrophomonas sp.]